MLNHCGLVSLAATIAFASINALPSGVPAVNGGPNSVLYAWSSDPAVRLQEVQNPLFVSCQESRDMFPEYFLYGILLLRYPAFGMSLFARQRGITSAVYWTMRDPVFAVQSGI